MTKRTAKTKSTGVPKAIASGEDGLPPRDPQREEGVETKVRKQTARPPRFKVILFNDDFTPMEFVVHILESFFSMPREKAIRVMLQVHTEGSGVCGTYSREIAETKVAQVNDYSRENNHPLLCTMDYA